MHVMVGGRIVESGTHKLAELMEERGYHLFHFLIAEDPQRRSVLGVVLVGQVFLMACSWKKRKVEVKLLGPHVLVEDETLLEYDGKTPSDCWVASFLSEAWV